MFNSKFAKSFVLLDDVGPSSKGDVFTLRPFQAVIPIVNDELVFKNKKNGHELNMKWFIENNRSKSKIKELFSSIEEKFEHIM